MFGKENQNGMYFGPNGATTSVAGNMAFVSGSKGHDGAYSFCGGSVVGPNGVTSITGTGDVKTAIGPDGVRTIVNNGSSSTIIGPDGVHTVFRSPGGGGTIF